MVTLWKNTIRKKSKKNGPARRYFAVLNENIKALYYGK
jgi:hypothetical protein